MGEVVNESSDQDYVMAEYEDRFQEIDSKLDAMRASFHDDKTNNHDHIGATIVVECDDDDDDNNTMDDDESLSLHVSKLQASLAEKSATEMERIVQEALQKQHLDKDDTHETSHSTIDPTNATVSTTKQNDLSSQHTTKAPRWMLLLVLVPTVLSALLAYQLWFSAPSPDSLTVVVVPQEVPVMRSQQTYTRQVCRTMNDGRRYCESEQESASVVGSSGQQTGAGQQHQQVYYQRQQCRYVNGESYCESYEESQQQSTSGESGQDEEAAVYY